MELIQNFKKFLLSQKPAPSGVTVKNYVADIRHFIAWYETAFSKPFRPQDITPNHISQFKEGKTKEYSVRSIERHISSLRKFFHALKLQGNIAHSPFDAISNMPKTAQDPWHMKEFKDFLYVYNASRLTIKNYIIDVKQFIQWVEQTAQNQEAGKLGDRNIFGIISPSLLEGYKTRLHEEAGFSASSVNRKLSSLRKYLNWAGQQGYLTSQIAIPDNLNNNTTTPSTEENIVPNIDINMHKNISMEIFPVKNQEKAAEQTTPLTKKPYSKFPPLRLLQKIGKGIDLGLETVLITPLTKGVILAHKQIWKLQGRPLFVSTKRFSGLTSRLSQVQTTSAPIIHNISKVIYAPHEISLKHFPLYRKFLFHARYTRPDWYRRYHKLAIAHYFNWAILIVFCTTIGFGLYNSFVAKPKAQPSLAAAAPPRILSFQGRLTDSNDIPITASTNLRFAIYSDLTSSGSALLWQETDTVTPDKNGVFSTFLGKDTTIPQSLFANNQNLYLGITVGSTSELTPRQQLATVAYATNSETLQGMPPITQSGAGTTNVILALDSSGNLSVGASTTFQSTTGQFTLAGNTVALNTNSGSNGNISIAPDGTGVIDLQKPLVNTTLNNNIGSNLGAVEVDDLFAVLATSAASAVIVNQNGSGALISASASGTPVFTVGNSGDITSTNYTVNGGIVYTNGSGLFLQTSAGGFGQCLTSNGGGAPIWSSCGSGSNYWTLDTTLGTLAPINSTLDVLFGGTSTASANFAFINNAPGSGTPTASISGNITLNSAGVIQTTNNQALTIGGTTTGNIILSPLSGNGTVTIGGLTAGVVHSNGSGVLSSSAVSLTADVSGILPLANGGTNNSLTADNGGIVYSDASKLQILTHASTVGQCLISGGSAAPNWGNCTSGGGFNWWNMNQGALSPVVPSLDLILGGNSTASANFAFINNAVGSGTPTASISGNITLNSAGILQTTNNRPLTLGGNTTGSITFGSNISSNFLPSATDAYNLGSSSLQWNTVYANSLILNGQTISQLFQRNLGVVAPLNITDDLAIGGTATATAKFQIFGNTGNATTAGNLTFDGNGVIQATNDQPLTLGGATTGNITFASNINSNLIPTVSNTYDVGSQTLQWNNIYASNIYQNGQLLTQTWQRNLGVLSPLSITDDVAVGGTATASAKFQIFGSTGNATTAGSLTFDGVGNLIQTTKNQALIIGGDTTGNITLSPLGGNGTVTISGLGTGVVHSTNGTLSSSNVSLTSEVTGILPIANGGTNTSTIGSAGRVVYSDGTKYAFTAVGSTGDCLISNGSGTPVWGSCSAAAGASNYWTQDNNLGILYPTTTYLDVLFGGTSTSSANFAFINNAVGSGTPTASISGNITLNSAGILQTTNNQPFTLGGTTTGNITLSPLGGNGTVTINGNKLVTTASSFDLINTTATTINFGGAATVLSIGASSGTTTVNNDFTVTGNTTLNGTVSLGNATGDTITAPGRFGSSLIPDNPDAHDIGASGLEWNNLYVKNIITTGSVAGFFQRNAGVLAPLNITDDLAIGGNATGSALFQVFGLTGNATTAGTLTFNGSGSLIQTTNNQALTLGGTTTGNITLSPLGGNGTVTVSGLGTGIVHSTNGVLSASTVSLTSEVNGILPLANGGTNNSLTADNGGIVYSDSSKLQILAHAATTGRCLLSGGAAAPTWGDCTLGGGTNWWTVNNGSLFSINSTLDFFVGGQATTSAKFAVLNMTGSGTPTASVSSGLNGNGISLAADGTIQTTNNQALTIGGTTTGNITLSPLGGNGTVTINGNKLVTTASSFDLINTTATTINFGGAADINLSTSGKTTAVNGALTVAGNANLNGNVNLGDAAGDQITVTGQFVSSLIPHTNNYDLGSAALQWNNIYGKNIFASGTIAGFFQRQTGVLSPNYLTDDLAIGGNATSSAKFQIFGNTGNATTAGSLTFNTAGSIQTTNNLPLTVGGDTTGNIILKPNNGSGNVTVNGSFNSNLVPSTTDAYDLGSSSFEWNNLYVKNIVTNGTLLGTWQRNLGVLAPQNITDDVAIGGNATGSALFQIFGLTGNATTAGTLTFNGSGSLIQTTNNQALTLGGTTTGNITLSPLGGNGTVTVDGAKLLTTASSFDLLNTTATTINFGGAADINLSTSGKTTTVNGSLTVAETANLNGNVNLGNSNTDLINPAGVFSGSIIPQSTSINLGSAANFFGSAYVTNLYPSTSSLYQGFFQRQAGVLSPNYLTDDLTIGGSSTASAKFQVFAGTGNITLSGTATINGTGASYIAGQLGIGLTPLTATALDVEKDSLGNAAAIFANLNTVGDLITASNSAGTKFVVTNAGNLSLVSGASIDSLTASGTINIGAGTNTATVVLGKSGGTVRAANLTTNGVVYVSGGNGTLNSEAQLATTRGGLGADVSPAGAGEILYSTSSTAYGHLAAAGSVGLCLTSNGAGAPSWATCATGAAATNWWQVNNGALYPINTSLDLLVGGQATASAKFAVLNMTGSGTPTASVSSGLNGNGISLAADGTIQTTNFSNMTIGGTTTGNITLTPHNGTGKVTVNGLALDGVAGGFTLFNSPVNLTFAGSATTLTIGATSGTTTIRTPTIDSSQATLTLFGTPTAITLGSGADVTLSNSGKTTTVNGALTVNGNTTLGTNDTNTVLLNGLLSGAGGNNAVQPSGNGTTDLGSAAHYWGTVYASNFIAPVNGGTSGFWQLTNSVISPVNAWNDLAVGGNATGSATPWQVFATTNGVNTAGTATSSAGLSFRGANTNIALLNGSVLKVQTSVGGDSGLSTQLQLDTNGDLTLGGSNIKTTQSTVNLFTTTATSINFGTGATSGITFGNASGTNTLDGNYTIGSNLTTNTIFLKAKFSASLIPNSTSIDLGATTNYFGSVYATNLFMASNAQYSGFWQVNSNVLSPVDAGNYDLAIGGTATSSAKFQVFANTGNATTAGTLTFNSLANSIIQTTNMYPLLLGSATTGTIQLSPRGTTGLYIDGSGNVGINTTSPLARLDVNGTASISSSLTFQTGAASIQASSNSYLTLGGNTTGAITFGSNVNSSIIPNATDTYNLGSDPTAGGKEWDTLYVRQIISPVGGGTAGYWQLSTGGVLAPANLTNDLAIGGTATSSAKFQVFAAGNTAGTMKLTPSDPQVNNNSGVLLASTKIINVASTDHTYMTLDNKDLTIGGHKNFQGLSNVQKVYIYDTSKDSDGGRWTNDERAQASSWYNEAATAADACVVGTNTRCGQQAFPRKAILVVTTTNLYIFDAKDNSLWMEFDKGSGSTEQMIGPTTNSTGSTVTALNGKIYFGNNDNTGTVGGLYVIDFLHDSSYKYLTTGYYKGGSTITNRNSTVTYSLNPNIAIYLPSVRIYDLSVNIINGSTYLAVGTRGSGNASTVIPPGGSVDLINESLMKQVATYGSVLTVGAIANNVWLTSTGDLYAVICTNSANPCGKWVLKVKHNAQNGSGDGVMEPFDEEYGYLSSTNYGVTTTDNPTTSSSTFYPGPVASTSANMNPTGLYVTEGTSTVDGRSNTIYLAEGGSAGALAVMQENQASPAAGLVKYYNSNDISEDMVGDIRTMLPMAGSGTLAANTTLSSPDSDVSVKGTSFTTKGATGQPTHATGVRGAGLSFDGSDDYLCTGASGTCTNNNADFDPGNGNLSISFWIKTSSNSKVMVNKQVTPTTSDGYVVQLDSVGRLQSKFQGTANITTTSVRTINDNNWHHIAVVFSRPTPGTACGSGNICTLSQYVDGQLDGQGTSTTLTTISSIAAPLTLMGDSVATAGRFTAGTMDEFAVTGSALTNAEIAHMYDVGYRALQNHSSKTIRGVATGADNNQKLINSNSNVSAVAANMQNGQIYIGTQGGGTTVFGMDTDSITDIYSSSSTTTDDAGTAWTADGGNNFVQSIATGQSFGNGTSLVIGTSPSSGKVWMETQDTNLKDWLATSYNPFGAGLTQSNLVVDNMFRVTNQISTRLDDYAVNATSSAALDLFQIDNTGAVLSRSTFANPNYVRFQDQSGNTLLGLNTVGGAMDTMLSLLQPGTGDIMIASSSAGTRLQLTNTGILRTNAFQDLDDPRYFLDPAAGTTSLAVAGSVGIGTTSPGQNLHIYANSNSSIGARIENSNTGSSAFAQLEFKNSFKQYNIGLGSVNTASFPNSFFIWDSSSNSARMTIDTTGNIGIGTTRPRTTALLDVASAVNQGIAIGSGASPTFMGERLNAGEFDIRTNIDLAGNLKDITKPSWITRQDASGDVWQIYRAPANSTTFTNFFTIASSGGVGIGTTNPVNKLQVNGSGGLAVDLAVNGRIQTGDASNDGGIWLDSADTMFVGEEDSTHIGFYNGGQWRAAIDSSGNVGIGTTGPVAKLSVIGGTAATSGIAVNNSDVWTTIHNSNDANNSGVIQVTSGGSSSSIGSTGYALSLNPSGGSVGIGTTSPGDKLEVAGGVRAQGYRTRTGTGGSYGGNYFNINWTAGGCFNFWVDTVNEGQAGTTCPSDERLKTDIQPFGDALSQINQLKPITFNWKAGTDNGTDLQTGFLAQDVMQIFPELVDHTDQITPWTPDGMYRLNYIGLISPAIRAIQELSATQSAHTTQLANLTLNTTGDISIQAATPSADFTVPQYYTLSDSLGHAIPQMGAFLELVVGNFRAGAVKTQQLFTDSLAIATTNVSIAGQSLHDYILSVVQSAGMTSGNVASTDSVKTNVISPLSGGNIALRLKDSGIEIAKDASSSAVAGIDNNGNATFSGSLNSQNLAVNGDATVNGTLHAHRIEADEIAGLSATVGTLSAQNITNVTNIYFATASATPIGTNSITGSNSVSSTSSGAPTPYLGYTDIASYSGFLAYVPHLNADTAAFSQGLSSAGSTSLSDTTINGQLAIGSQLILADNSVNVLGGTFQIQSLRQGNVTFEGGLIAIDTDGNLTVNGNAVFGKSVAVNFITPLSNDRDIILKLGENSTATGSALATSTLSVQNASGSGIFQVDQLGNLIASGAANIAKLNFQAVAPALAVSNTEVIATGSAGTATIKAHQTEVTIDNKLVTPKSLIYITPVGQSNYTPYLLRQVNGTSFTVGIPVQQYTDTLFNWLIVN